MAVIGLTGVVLFFTPEYILDPTEIPRLSVLTVEGMMFLTAYLGAYTIFSGGLRYYLVLASHKLESEIIDRFFHEWFPSRLKRIDRRIESIHSADLPAYFLWLIIGFVGVILFLVFL